MTKLIDKQVVIYDDQSDLLKSAKARTGKNTIDLAREIGINRVTFSKWINGRGKPDIENIPDLAAALGLDASDVYKVVYPKSYKAMLKFIKK